MFVPMLNAILFMFYFLFFMHIASRIRNRFLLLSRSYIVFIFRRGKYLFVFSKEKL